MDINWKEESIETIININEICRVCMETGENMIDIFSKVSDEYEICIDEKFETIRDIIIHFASINVNIN